jgi:hypothetical protein
MNIVTCYLRSQPIQRFIARQQLRRYATVLETLLGRRPRVTMEVQLEELFSMGSVPRSYLEDTWGELPVTNIWPWVPAGPGAKIERAGWLPAVSFCFCFCQTVKGERFMRIEGKPVWRRVRIPPP